MDLSLIPFEDIMKELDNRFEHWIFSGVQIKFVENSPNKENKILTIRKWNGNSATCIGLASMIEVAIYDENMSKNELENKDDMP